MVRAPSLPGATRAFALGLTFLLAACGRTRIDVPPEAAERATSAAPVQATGRAPAIPAGRAEAIFAGGCFWCMERPFEELDGVYEVVSGYTGGHVPRPTYEAVSGGDTGHYEAVRVVYDPARITYARLLEVFVHNVDPTQPNGQFCDRGAQYRTAIFVGDARERAEATAALARAQARLGASLATEVRDRAPFYVAEDYHQDFYRTHPDRYAAYRLSCGRDARLRDLWGEGSGH